MHHHRQSDVARLWHFRTGRRKNDEIEWRIERSEFDRFKLVGIACEIAEKRAARTHFAAALIRHETREECPVMRSGKRHEMIDALQTAQPLHIVTADEPAHAESD